MGESLQNLQICRKMSQKMGFTRTMHDARGSFYCTYPGKLGPCLTWLPEQSGIDAQIIHLTSSSIFLTVGKGNCFLWLFLI